MLKRSRSRSRPQGRVSRSLSSPSSASGRDAPWTGHVFIFLGALLLLGSVVFLQLKLGNVGSSTRQNGSSGKQRGLDLFSNGQLVGSRDDPAAGAAESEVSVGVKGSERLRLIEDNGKLKENKVGIFGSQNGAAVETEGVKSRTIDFPHERSITLAETGSDEIKDDGKYDEDDEDSMEDAEVDVDLDTEDLEELDSVGDSVVANMGNLEEDEESEKEEFEEYTGELDESGNTTKAKAVKNEVWSEGKAHESQGLTDKSLRSEYSGKENKGAENNTQKVDRDVVERKEPVADMKTREATFSHTKPAVISIPRWDWMEHQWTGSEDARNTGLDRQQLNAEESSHTSTRERMGLVWDHLLGVARRSKKDLPRKFGGTSFHMEHLGRDSSGYNRSLLIFGGDGKQVFSSDDEPLDEDIRQKLEEVTTVEDALLLKADKMTAKNGLWASWFDNAKKSLKADPSRKDKPVRVPFDSLNPLNNPLLQDPDTFGPTGLTKSDKAILKAMQKSFEGPKDRLPNQDSSSDANLVDTSKSKVHQDDLAFNQMASGEAQPDKEFQREFTAGVDIKEHLTQNLALVKGRKLNEGISNETTGLYTNRSILSEVNDSKTSFAGQLGLGGLEDDASIEEELDPNKFRNLHWKPRSNDETRRWGYFPGLDPMLSFSEFLEKFLDDRKCSLKVFMAWMTPPWSYTLRYQRGLESLLYFHPQACVAIFSESLELNFFNSFVLDGYRVSVVIPNLEELLGDTPADAFALVWLDWRKIEMFYIHYTELLRLVALYKYGGIYLDSDVILLKPLNDLNCTIGMASAEEGKESLNGAIMAFDKFSPFLWECLLEFTATYDDQLLDWNGAGLLNRVANRTLNVRGKKGERLVWNVNIKPPYSFFPLSANNITRYFTAPVIIDDQQEQEGLFQMILRKSHAVHFWNHATASLVPDTGSLIEKIMNLNCLRCSEYL